PQYKGDAAMIMGVSNQEAVIKTAQQPIDLYDFYLPPTDRTPVRFMASPHQWMIAKATKALDGSLDAVTWISQPALQQKYFAALGEPATSGAEPNEKDWPRSAKWARVMGKTTDTYPPSDQAMYEELMGGYFEVQDGVVAGRITPENGAKQMQQKAT